MRAARTRKADLTKACLVAAGLVVVALLMGAQPASGQRGAVGQYSITDLGSLGGEYGVARGINNRGQVVGFADDTAWSESHALLWEDGEMADLGALPDGEFSAAYDINNRGQVVGASDTASGWSHAVLWSK